MQPSLRCPVGAPTAAAPDHILGDSWGRKWPSNSRHLNRECVACLLMSTHLHAVTPTNACHFRLGEFLKG
jgi:hypothetical protein